MKFHSPPPNNPPSIRRRLDHPSNNKSRGEVLVRTCRRALILLLVSLVLGRIGFYEDNISAYSLMQYAASATTNEETAAVETAMSTSDRDDDDEPDAYQNDYVEKDDDDENDDETEDETDDAYKLPVLHLEKKKTKKPNQEVPKALLSESDESLTTSTSTFTLSPNKNRTIALIHVGKAGGLTLRSVSSLKCRLAPKAFDTPQKMNYCLRRYMPPIDQSPLAHAIQYYAHIWEYNDTQLADATSYLFVLRNPVDRMISSYKYSHPHNCLPKHENMTVRPWGCEVHKRWDKRNLPEYQLYRKCFPSAAMESFAQSVLSPFQSAHFADNTNLTNAQQYQCRWIARQMVQGRWAALPAPHAYYNYHYYQLMTQEHLSEDKEIFGVRTDHEWEDIKALDRAMGGSGYFKQEGKAVSHGSEAYVESPLSTEAYQKLCCVLEHEIQIYGEILKSVVNLNVTQKQDCMDDVKNKCGISTTWKEWRSLCKKRLRADAQMIQPHVEGTKWVDLLRTTNLRVDKRLRSSSSLPAQAVSPQTINK